MMIKDFKKKDTFGFIGFILIGIFSYFYSIYHRDFAKVHIQLPSVDFPLFVGEILLLVCFILLILHWRSNNIQWNKWHTLINLYFLWVVIKTCHGYFSYGPLTFRNAALYYYPMFAVIGYYFFDRKFFPQWLVMSLLALMTWTFFVIDRGILSYDRYIYLMLALVLVSALRGRWPKILALVVLFVTYPFDILILAPRSLILAFLVGSIVFLVCLLFFLLRIRLLYKLLILFSTIAMLFFSVKFFGEAPRIESFKKFGTLVDMYKEKDGLRKEREKDFVFKEIEPRLYSKEKRGISEVAVQFSIDKLSRLGEEIVLEDNVGDASVREVIQKYIEQAKQEYIEIINSNVYDAYDNPELRSNIKDRAKKQADLVIQKYKEIIFFEITGLNVKDVEERPEELNLDKEQLRKLTTFIIVIEGDLKSFGYLGISRSIKPVKDRNVLVEQGNIVFRLFIWDDMRDEMIESKAFFGINFGKPQRSKSIEMLEWAKEEWLRDGWITPHNSFLHMIYRGGVVGLGLIIVFLYIISITTRRFIKEKSFAGIFLISAFANWFIIINLLVILEFPYNAIPFWSLLGMTLAYSQSLKQEIHA